MMRFEDYHRTVIGYHGTRLSVALDIVNRRKPFDFSRNETDWLGHGVYFWEYAPQQALWWAERLKKRSHRLYQTGKRKGSDPWDEPIAILGSMIRLGFCLDLLDPHNIKYAKRIHKKFCEDRLALGLPIPKNFKSKRYLDCAVFQSLYASFPDDEGQQSREIDSARAAYVTTDEKKRIWPGSWIYDDSHIQICVRNPASILGTWLHHPQKVGDLDGLEESKTAENRVEPENRPSRQTTRKDDTERADSTSGEGGIVDSGGGG